MRKSDRVRWMSPLPPCRSTLAATLQGSSTVPCTWLPGSSLPCKVFQTIRKVHNKCVRLLQTHISSGTTHCLDEMAVVISLEVSEDADLLRAQADARLDTKATQLCAGTLLAPRHLVARAQVHVRCQHAHGA